MKFTMSRDKCVSTTLGRSFDFVKNEPLYVPDFCWDAVQAAGAVPEDELPEGDPDAPVVPTGEERKALIKKAIEAMVLKGQRGDFTASGSPSAQVLSATVGFTVDAKERDASWAAAQNDDKS